MTDSTRDISVDLISHPADQQRIDLDDVKLAELARSIKEHGLISPICVRQIGDRYELIAGSRRLQAHKILGKPLIRAVVTNVSDEESDVLRAHENEFRAEINPVEAGIYYRRLKEKHNWDDERIAKEMNRNVLFIRSRLELLEYPEYILEPLALGKLSLGAAGHLAKITDEKRQRQYVFWAVQNGISVSQASAWRQHAELRGIVQDMSELPADIAGAPKGNSALRAECVACAEIDELTNLGMCYLHDSCLNAFVAAAKTLRLSERPEPAATPSGAPRLD